MTQSTTPRAPTPAELLPCPFCGGHVELERARDTRDEIMGPRQWWGVKCRNTINLGGTCAIEQVPSASPEAAIERWNRRALTADASEDAPFGYVVWQPDGHETYFKEDPTAFRKNGWPELGVVVHTLFSGAAPEPILPSVTLDEAALLAGVQCLCIAADQEWCRQEGKLSEWDQAWFKGQLHVFDMYTPVEKTAIAQAREYIEKLSVAVPACKLCGDRGTYCTGASGDASDGNAPIFEQCDCDAAFPGAHPDDIAVDKFATAIKAEMAAQRTKGRGGWDDPAQCHTQDLAASMIRQIDNGEIIKVSAYAMMLFNRNCWPADLVGAMSLYFQDARRDAVSEDDLCALLPGSYYMDPPDGGSVPVIEQLRRMGEDAAKYRALAARPAPVGAGMARHKDHEVREFVNTLRDIATRFHAAGQLRERIAYAVQDFLAVAPAAPVADASERERCNQAAIAHGIAGQSHPDDLLRFWQAARAPVADAGGAVDDTARIDWLGERCTGTSDSERYLPFRVYWGNKGATQGIRAQIDKARAASATHKGEENG